MCMCLCVWRDSLCTRVYRRVACMRKTFKFVAVAHCEEALVDCQFIQNVVHSSEQYSYKVPLGDVILWLGMTK
jgi:hypothetical protein